MNLNPHHFRNALNSALLIAFPGAVFSAFMIGIFAHYVLPYSWPWSLSMILGAILCTTDAVAVVSFLKDVGASYSLQYLLVGETLFNDATALILYNILYTMIKIDHTANDVSPLSIVLYLLRVVFISPLLGLAFGFGALFFVGLANRRMLEGDTTIQMAVTICCAYLSFFVGEAVLNVSGVICCVVAGLVLSNFASPLILHRKTMDSIWSAIEWIGNTLIFILAGLIIGSRSIRYLEGRDVIYIVVLYLFFMASRAVMMMLCFPILSRIGNKCTVNEALFVTWGGLRGAVSMAIALVLSRSVDNRETIVSSLDSHRLFILVGGVAVLTLLVNAPLSQQVMQRLGLVDSEDSTAENHVMFNYVKKRLFKKSLLLLDQVCDCSYSSCRPLSLTATHNGVAAPPYTINRQLVVSFVSIFSQYRLSSLDVESSTGWSSAQQSLFQTDIGHGLEKRVSGQYILRINSVRNGDNPSSRPLVSHEEVVVHVRRAFLEVVRVNYWKQINSGKLPRKSTATLALLNSIDVAMEAHDSPGLGDWLTLLDTNRGLFAPPRREAEEEEDAVEIELATRRAEQQAREKSVFDTMKEATQEHYAEIARQKAAEQGVNEKGKRAGPDDAVMEEEDPMAAAAARWRAKAARAREAKRQGGQNVPAAVAFAEQPVDSAQVPLDRDKNDRETPSPLLDRLSQWKTFLDFRNTMQHLSIATQYDGQPASSNLPPRARPPLNPWTFLGAVRREYLVAKKVYLLTSFIEAHEYAQHKIQFFLRESDMIDQPEENLVVNESRDQVRQARAKLAEIDSNVIALQVSKQTARWILHVQEDMVAEFQREGVLLERDAALLLGEVQRDLSRLGSVEWSSIVMAKIAHTIESKVCYPCHFWCNEEHDTDTHHNRRLESERDYGEEETKEAPEMDLRGGGLSDPRVGGMNIGQPLEFVTISNTGRTFAV
eukprot:gene23862-30138_t